LENPVAQLAKVFKKKQMCKGKLFGEPQNNNEGEEDTKRNTGGENAKKYFGWEKGITAQGPGAGAELVWRESLCPASTLNRNEQTTGRSKT